jgi:hypothetical protein
MYHPVEFGEAGERSYPGRCNPHAWLKSGAIQPAKWFPVSPRRDFRPTGSWSLSFAASPCRRFAVTSVICVRMHASLFVRVGKSFGRLPVLPEENNSRRPLTESVLPYFCLESRFYAVLSKAAQGSLALNRRRSKSREPERRNPRRCSNKQRTSRWRSPTSDTAFDWRSIGARD